MHHDLVVHSRTELDMLLVNIEAAVKIKHRPDFFSWVQGVFQGMIAHEVLVCGLAHPVARGLRMEWIGSFPATEERIADLCRADGGVIPALMPLWEQGGRQPIFLSDAPATEREEFGKRLLEQIRKLDLVNVVAHGLPGLDGQPAAFFAFFKLPGFPLEREARMLNLLLPYLHAAWLRACCGQPAQAISQSIGTREILTAREIEILLWVERGKSNNEIAQILSISPLTVKNHVQKILRKLNVQNRAQAVAKGISLNLTQPIGLSVNRARRSMRMLA
jgi:transcriptional regulator EpsA